MRLTKALVLICLGLWSAAPAFAQGAALPGPQVPPRDTAAPAAPAAMPHAAGTVSDNDHYRLGTGDKVSITVYGETDLSGDFTVDSAGQVQLPLVGQVKAAGLTIHEFVDEVTTTLRQGYLKDPKVSIQVMNFRPFYIMGEVLKPGEYQYESGLSVLSAVALAGGFTYRADDSEVYIRHIGEQKEHGVRVDSAAKVEPGDIIRVDERLF